MTSLPASTQHRLKQLTQIPSVWEGDRRTLSENGPPLEFDGSNRGDCILWVDGSEGFVRSMDIVSPEMGLEAVVRTLIRAMETPHSPAKPARPQKIIVRNREIQFFLRGALQSLDIAIDYVPELPLIDELFCSFEAVNNNRPPSLPPFYEKPLQELAKECWEVAPWELLADHDIIAIEIENEDFNPVYACIMGMLGQEYGLILYRSLDSVNQFRQAALAEKSTEQLEKAFLAQDCWFLNYEAADGDEDADLGELEAGDINAIFGSIHPLEGIRPFLDEVEAKTLSYVLQGFLRFFRDHESQLSQDPIGEVRQRYRLPSLDSQSSKEKIAVSVYTLPDLAQELLEMMDDDDDDDDDDDELSLRDDLVPENAYLSLGVIPWDLIETLKLNPKTYYQGRDVKANGEGMPVLVIQTSRPKAQTLIQTLREEDGIAGLCFNQGEDSWTETRYDLGILLTGAKHLYLFGEFLQDDATHQKARQKWDSRCKKTGGYCGILVAMGITGSSKGNPKLPDMLAFFETNFFQPQDLGLGSLKLMPQFDVDW
jgi:hypothetical protein